MEAAAPVYTTTISMEVTYVAPPTDLTIKNQAGEDVTSVTMEQFKNISPIQLSAQNNPTNWRVEPTCPTGSPSAGATARSRARPR